MFEESVAKERKKDSLGPWGMCTRGEEDCQENACNVQERFVQVPRVN